MAASVSTVSTGSVALEQVAGARTRPPQVPTLGHPDARTLRQRQCACQGKLEPGRFFFRRTMRHRAPPRIRARSASRLESRCCPLRIPPTTRGHGWLSTPPISWSR